MKDFRAWIAIQSIDVITCVITYCNDWYVVYWVRIFLLWSFEMICIRLNIEWTTFLRRIKIQFNYKSDRDAIHRIIRANKIDIWHRNCANLHEHSQNWLSIEANAFQAINILDYLERYTNCSINFYCFKSFPISFSVALQMSYSKLTIISNAELISKCKPCFHGSSFSIRNSFSRWKNTGNRRIQRE